MANANSLVHLAELAYVMGPEHGRKIREGLYLILQGLDLAEFNGITAEHGFSPDSYIRIRRRVGRALNGFKPVPRQKPEEASANGTEGKRRK